MVKDPKKDSWVIRAKNEREKAAAQKLKQETTTGGLVHSKMEKNGSLKTFINEVFNKDDQGMRKLNTVD